MKYILFQTLFFLICIGSVKAQSQNPKDSSEFKLPTYSIYAELGGIGGLISINSDIIIPLYEKLGIVARGGITFNEHWYLLGEINALVGGPKHFLEFGIGSPFLSLNNYANEDLRRNPVILYRYGYRYQAINGFLLRPALQMYTESENGRNLKSFFWFGLSLGYSF